MPKPKYDKRYWIPMRDYKHLQEWVSGYYDWVKEYTELMNGAHCPEIMRIEKGKAFVDPTANRGIMMAERSYKIQLVNKIISSLTQDNEFRAALLSNLAAGTTYSVLRRSGLEVSKDDFFQKRRQFFWLLNQARLYF